MTYYLKVPHVEPNGCAVVVQAYEWQGIERIVECCLTMVFQVIILLITDYRYAHTHL